MVTTIVLAVALMGLIAVNSSVAYGQAISGSLVGTVIDSSSAVVSNASVEAIKIDTGVATTTKTGGTGAYRFENLPVGTYKITVKSRPNWTIRKSDCAQCFLLPSGFG